MQSVMEEVHILYDSKTKNITDNKKFCHIRSMKPQKRKRAIKDKKK